MNEREVEDVLGENKLGCRRGTGNWDAENNNRMNFGHI
jgi:hypothetical protein